MTNMPAPDKKRVRAMMRNVGINQSELAIAAGMSGTALSNTIIGIRRLQLDEAITIARRLNVSLTVLLAAFGFSTPPDPERDEMVEWLRETANRCNEMADRLKL